MSTLTPEAKSKLAKTIRALRERLLRDLHDRADSAYRLAVPLHKAGLAEEYAVKRQRLEEWTDEQARSQRAKGEDLKDARERHRREAEKLAAATFLNRLVVVKHLEAMEIVRPKVVTGGWDSSAYRELRGFAPELLKDETEGYSTLLKLLFDELALRLPGLFGEVGVSALFEIPPATLRHVVEALDDPELESAWADDTTLGWVYQYWNDPERDALDAKLHGGGKVEPHEIASKTQMFTERYMVEWLLQNSLGQMWLAICRKHRWVSMAASEGVLKRLELRRREWRAKREAGEVELDELMPISGGLENRWKYWMPQPMPKDAIENAPDSVREIKILDPACGSGHFLIIAFDILCELYREEAGHRGESWKDRKIVESILERNLHGIDIDPRAVQIAAAALTIKAWTVCPHARLSRLNLVASNLNLGDLPESDPGLIDLRRGIREETGVPEELTDRIIQTLRGADHLGSLLQIGREVHGAIKEFETRRRRIAEEARQQDLFQNIDQPEQLEIEIEETRDSILERLEHFLERHGGGDDLGLRLRGGQLAAGIRFMRLLREGSYSIVISNPPYQGVSRLVDAEYVEKSYPTAKSDLYSAFIDRSLQLIEEGGVSAFLAMRNWMFLTQFTSLRERVLEDFDFRLVSNLDRGAFEDVPDEIVAVAMTIIRNARPGSRLSVCNQPTPLDDRARDNRRTARKRAAVLAQVGRFVFSTQELSLVPASPVIYWWSPSYRKMYAAAPKLGKVAPVRNGMSTQDNVRFLRRPWEIPARRIYMSRDKFEEAPRCDWAPYIKGAEGRIWMEGLRDVTNWRNHGLEVKVFNEYKYRNYTRTIKSEALYFKLGVAFSMIGTDFYARRHRFRSVFGHMGASVFPPEAEIGNYLCLMNSSVARYILKSLNPGFHFLVSDVNRLSVFPVQNVDVINARIEAAFSEHETRCETSPEFRSPGSTTWTYVKGWAQKCIDTPYGSQLPAFDPVHEPASPTSYLSFFIGVALGRFGRDGEGLSSKPPKDSLPHSFLFLSAANSSDDLDHPACRSLQEAWAEHGGKIDSRSDLRSWLRKRFFSEVHLKMYDKKPIYLPISSARCSFVVLASIHGWRDDTLQAVLAERLLSALTEIEGEVEDLLVASRQGEVEGLSGVEQRYGEMLAYRNELQELIDNIRKCAEDGPPATSPNDKRREVGSRFSMCLDDGIMINSAALWPLVEPQWKEPKVWWSELCNERGKKGKHYDWSRVAACYFPGRVDRKCRADPSLAIAHRRFWTYHPETAYKWELRLQDEIAEDFKLDDEPDSAERRAAFEKEYPEKVKALKAAEAKRRQKKRKDEEKEAAKKSKMAVTGPLFADQETSK